ESVLHQLFGSVHHGRDLLRRLFVVSRYHWLLGIVRTRRVDAHLAVTLDRLYLTSERGPDVLRIRVGNNAGRNGFPRNFSGLIGHATARHRNVADRVGAFPHDVRCWHDQSARRPVLARSQLPFLSLRNAAVAEPAELVFASCAALVPQSRRVVQSLHRTHGAVVLLRARATLLLGRRNYHRVPDHADPERQSFLAQLHHDRALHSVFRRSLPFAFPLGSPPAARRPGCTARNRGRL